MHVMLLVFIYLSLYTTFLCTHHFTSIHNTVFTHLMDCRSYIEEEKLIYKFLQKYTSFTVQHLSHKYFMEKNITFVNMVVQIHLVPYRKREKVYASITTNPLYLSNLLTNINFKQYLQI